ncbi:excalibur calcium-binding protein [Streptomyces longwoodensis]|uniref:excalibur calcium-binding protein n=1 Tax=Streptomyces longwoodensis TaxID=68231 RepID=UPI00381DAE8B
MLRRSAAVGTLFALAALVPSAVPAHAQDLDCHDFAYQEDAQAVFDADRTDRHRLDEDQGPDDGIACEALPRRAGATTSSTHRPKPTPTAVPTSVPTRTVTPTATVRPTTVVPTRGVQGGLGGASDTGPTGWDVAIGATFVAGAAVATGFVVRRRRG